MNTVADLARAFGSVIAEERRRKGMTQKLLAERIGASELYISFLECGQRKPSLNSLILIAGSLGLEPAELTRRVCSELESVADSRHAAA